MGWWNLATLQQVLFLIYHQFKAIIDRSYILKRFFFVGGGPEPSLSKLTYFPDKACLKMTFPFSKVGYVIVFWRVYRNIINYPERGELSREKLMNLSMLSDEIHIWTCEFPNGSKWLFFFNSGVKSSHCQYLDLSHILFLVESSVYVWKIQLLTASSSLDKSWKMLCYTWVKAWDFCRSCRHFIQILL